MNDRITRAWTTAIGGGAVLWLVVAGISGRREAWDSSLYWIAAYPLSIGLAGYLGYRFPEKPWRWGLAVMWAQAMVLIVSAADFSLLPLGLIVFSILALPTVGAARHMAGRRLRSRNS